MNKQEYMQDLKSRLSIFPEELSNEIMEDYEEHFRVGMSRGKSEEQICGELGDVTEMIEEIKELQGYTGQGFERSGSADQETDKREELNQAEMRRETENSEEADRKAEQDPAEHPDTEQKTDFGKAWSKAVLQEEPADAGTNEKEQPITEGKAAGRQELSISRVVIDGIFADVTVQKSADDRVEIVYENSGNERDQSMYHFYKRIEGKTIYAGLEKTDLYSGILRFLSVPRIRITVFAPQGMDEIAVTTASGDVEFYETDSDKVTGKSASGDIRLETVRTGHGTFSSLSGDVRAHSVMGSEISFSSKSGNLKLENCDIDRIHGSSLSGNVKLEGIKSDRITGKSTSGNVKLSSVAGKELELSSISGDVKVESSKTGYLSASAKSGSVKVEAGIGEADLNSISGNIHVDLRNGAEGYRAEARTVSGSVTLQCGEEKVKISGKGTHTFGNGEIVIRAKTVSGSIRLNG